ncbi:Uncharacterised protein [Pantoea agglomerans]|uniref:Uncharacterized protein n=1 Tax=Enterobacter agglomerans TaxID=549 RepID=A0A379LQN6_ENTAG|nr:Uncharacterised protein [Pantoea agglomerans]
MVRVCAATCAREEQRRRQTPLILMKMVLSNPRIIKSAAFGMLNLFGGQLIALFRRHLIQQSGKKSETSAHADSLWVKGISGGMAAINSRV